MLESIRELIRFYSHKYHLPVALVTDPGQIEDWDRNSILVTMPAHADQEKFAADLVINHDVGFGRQLGSDPILLDEIVMGRAGKQSLVMCFYPVNPKAWDFARKLIERYLPPIARSFRHQQKDQLVDAIAACAADKRKELRSSIREDSYELERLSLQVMQLSRKLETDRQVQRMFEKPEDWIKARANRTYVDLMKLAPGIFTGFRFEEESVIGMTDDIFLSHDGQEFSFKPFEVEVNLRQGKVFISGGTNVNGYIHPHVTDESSNICWGNIGPLVNRLAGELDLFPLFQLIHQFLCAYNPNDPYQRIEKWDPDYEEPEDDNEPYCSWCDDYGHDIADCDSCWWCDCCNEYVDHDEENCPKWPKETDEEKEAESVPIETAA
jgi:hypothetical protein